MKLRPLMLAALLGIAPAIIWYVLAELELTPPPGLEGLLTLSPMLSAARTSLRTLWAHSADFFVVLLLAGLLTELALRQGMKASAIEKVLAISVIAIGSLTLVGLLNSGELTKNPASASVLFSKNGILAMFLAAEFLRLSYHKQEPENPAAENSTAEGAHE